MKHRKALGLANLNGAREPQVDQQSERIDPTPISQDLEPQRGNSRAAAYSALLLVDEYAAEARQALRDGDHAQARHCLGAVVRHAPIPAAIVDKARGASFLAALERLGLDLKRVTATELAGPCPQCGGRDRAAERTPLR